MDRDQIRTGGSFSVAPAPSRNGKGHELDINWASGVSDEEWRVYLSAVEALRSADLRFMLGGGFAQASFTGRWRNTKDIDFYVLPEGREAAIRALTAAGFTDYYPQVPYDRNWIYRSTSSGVIVDVIWSMANQRAQVDELWLERAGKIVVRGQELLVLPMEEFMWCKIYILQRDRCDWIDILNLIYTNGARLDWEHLIWRLGEDLPLLQALLQVYGWLHPERALLLPQRLRDKLGLPTPTQAGQEWRVRVRLLDSRTWFTALRSRGERLEI